jgi:HlyD family secretion protein
VVDSTDVLGTISSGVVTYNVYIKLNSKDIRIKPNMSVNAEILLSELKNVLKVDNNAIKGEEEKFIRIVKEKIDEKKLEDVELIENPERVKVEVGESNDEFIEIKEGLNEGDIVVLKTNNPQTTVQQNSLFNLFRPGGNNTRGGAAGSQSGTQRNFQR